MRTRSTTASATSCSSRIMGAETPAGRRRLRHRHPRELGGGAGGSAAQGRQALRHSGRRLGAQIRRPRLCRLRRGSAGAGAALGPRASTISSSALSPARRMPAWWWASPRTDAQRNVIGIDASGTPAQTKAQVLDIARNTAALVGGTGHRRGRCRPAGGLCLSPLRRAVDTRRRRRSACRRASRA